MIPALQRLLAVVRRDRGQAGVTVVELAVAMAVLLVAVAVVLGGLQSTNETAGFVERRKSALNDLRTTMSQVTKEGRQAAEVIVTPTSFKMNTFVEGAATVVTYSVDSSTGQLRRAVGTGTPRPVGITLSDTSEVFVLVPGTAAERPKVIVKLVTKPEAKYPSVVLTTEVVLRNAI